MRIDRRAAHGGAMGGGNISPLRAVSPGNWVALERLMDDVLDAPPENRRELLVLRCANDQALYDVATAWLDACERDNGLLNSSPDADSSTGLSAGTRVGNWRLLEEIGRGGMGAVFLAERTDAELPMKAALKFMHRVISFDAVGVRRFRDERRILAALEHPAIARLLDGGVDDGLPWFAMEYVPGAAVDQWADVHALPVEARITLFCRVCEAVQHAHARLIVHRDLKPANILVSESGDPKLLDFGIAKLLANAESSGNAHTRPGSQPMTVAYAAPEQLRGDAPSTASDIYSLGVLLHLLLCGQLPREGMRMSAALLLPPLSDTPNTEFSVYAAAARGTTVAKLHRQLQGDLDTIVARAMHTEQQRRYPTADALAADLRRHLDGRTVLARPDTAAYRIRKFVTRHAFGSTIAAAGTALVIAFTIVTSVQANRLRAQATALREQAGKLTNERDKATEVTQFLTDLISSADPYQSSGHIPTLHEVLDRGAKLAETSLADRPDVRAHLLSSIAPAYFGLGDWDRAGKLAEQALAIRRATLAPSNPEIAASLLYLASVRLNQRQNADAEKFTREAIAIFDQNTVARVDRISAISQLGAVLQRQGRLDEAQEVIRTLLVDERAHQPVDSARIAQLSRNLAHVLRDKHSYAEAVPLYQDAYNLHLALFGRSHPETANSAVNLGNAYSQLGNATATESLLRAGVATKKQLLGAAHPDVIEDQLTLSRALERAGKHAEARAMQREAETLLATKRRD